MFVPAAMYARFADRVMNVPAEAALAPGGPTQTMTGRGGSSSFATMSWVASRLPPGVSSSIITAAAPSAAALSTPLRM